MRLTTMAEVKTRIFAVRVTPRGAEIIEAAIAAAGITQSEFFRIAIEAQLSSGGLESVSFVRGREQGHRDAAFLMQKFSADLSETAAKIMGEEPDADEWSDDGG